MKYLLRLLFGISLVTNCLLFFWGNEQLKAARFFDQALNKKESERLQQLRFLSSFLADSLPKENVVVKAKSENMEYFEKEGMLVVGSISFKLSLDGETVKGVDFFEDYSK